MRGSPTGFIDDGPWKTGAFWNYSGGVCSICGRYMWAADVNGDGKQDIIVGTQDLSGNWSVMLSTGTGFADPIPWWSSPSPNIYYDYLSHSPRIRLFDVDGDGMTDVLLGPSADGSLYLLRSTGTAFEDRGAWIRSALTGWDSDDVQNRVRVMDVNGDGLLDLVLGPDANGTWWVLINRGATGFVYGGPWITAYAAWSQGGSPLRIRAMDVNGDGKTDIVLGPDGAGKWYVLLSTGASFVDAGAWITGAYASWADDAHAAQIRAIDVNGDGMMDLVIGPESGTGNWYVLQSTGSGFVDKGIWLSGIGAAQYSTPGIIRPMDVNGDGRVDIVIGPDASGNWPAALGLSPFPDFPAKLRNGYGAATAVQYLPSTRFNNRQLPFPVQVVSSVAIDDGDGLVATTQYSYSGGYYHTGDRDFRGFASSTVTGPAWPNGAKLQTTTYFHQGNDVAIGANDPTVTIGYMKGRPYRVRGGDTVSSAYTLSETAYRAPDAGTAYYFDPPADVYSSFCTNDVTCGRQTRTRFQYDAYGNAIREDRYGDISVPLDARTVIRSFFPNALGYSAPWILGLPCDETIYSGTDAVPPLPSNQISKVSYRYDGQGGCSATVTPTVGNLTWTSRWLNGGTDSVATAVYDSYGNVTTKSDPNGFSTQIGFDATRTFPTSVTNALGRVIGTKYYGVDGVAWSAATSDPGFFGLPQSAVDPNLATTTLGYDVFGRLASKVEADGFATTWSYNSAGTVGSQNTRTSSPEGNAEVYFDGLGRTIKTRRQGSASGRWVVSQTSFLATGVVAQKSGPYFETGGSPAWTSYQYDVRNRPTRTTGPDGALALACYDDLAGASAVIDGNSHKKRERRDVQGRTVEIDEYAGNYGTCTADLGTPYATTKYKYAPLETDIFNAVSTPLSPSIVTSYDTLGRRILSSDPDLGNWSYVYDAAGNVKLQIDANGKGMLFNYDQVGRLTLKHPCTATTLAACQAEGPSLSDVTLSYDDPAVQYSKGRLTRMTDSSGSSAYGYDILGRQISKTQVIGTASLTTSSAFDFARRLQTLTYPQPDGSQISYSYDPDGNLSTVRDSVTTYATLSGYTAAGQAGRLMLADNSTIDYSYDPNTYRVSRIYAFKGVPLLDLTYAYDSVGNVVTINDARSVSPSNTQHFRYDELNRLTYAESPGYAPNNTMPPAGLSYNYDSVRVHVLASASDGRSFTYDSNGNTKSDGLRTMSWDAENRTSSVTIGGVTTNITYDGTGARVKKQQGSNAIVYSGKLFECNNPPTCTQYTRHIFAGFRRIAQVNAGSPMPSYYEADHLNSTRVITGTQSSLANYQPFGRAISDASTVHYKFTGQEWDAETSLYNYGARLYDPALGRFMSADAVIPSGNPQSLNRYAYALDNPLKFTDPSGRIVVLDDVLIGAVVGAVVGGTMASLTGRDVLKGAAMGAISGAFLGFASGVVTNAGISSTGPVNAAIIGGSGAASGAVNAAVFGGNVPQGAAVGAAFALVGSAAPVPNFQIFGCARISCDNWVAPVAGSVNRVLNSALTGGAIGAAYATMTGENILEGAIGGAKAWSIGAGVNIMAGHAMGFLATAATPSYDEKNDVFVYDKGLTPVGRVFPTDEAAVTIGNVITAGPGVLAGGNRAMPGTTIMDHELAHVRQSLLGLSYIPVNIVFLILFQHQYNVFERYWIDVPSF
jgi:RHS repeat-associated protein